MKKATLIFVMFFGTLLLTGCTDTSKELEQLNEVKELDIKLTTPSNNGKIDDEEEEETGEE